MYSARHPLVLIADDDLHTCRMMKRCIGRGGIYGVEITTDVDELPSCVKELGPDLLYLDQSFGESRPRGTQVLMRMRQEGYDGVVCMLTGDQSLHTMIEAMVSGADDFIVKCSRWDWRLETERLLEAISRHSSRPGEALLDSGYWRSRGVGHRQQTTIRMLLEHGFPVGKSVCESLGTTETGLWKRVSRLMTKLGMDNVQQVAALAMAITAMRSRSRPH